MDCTVHHGRTAVNTCSICGSWLCEDCSVEINGRIFCKSCVAQKVMPESTPRCIGMPSVPGMASQSYSPTPPPTRRQVNFLGLLFFSLFPPGVNYMYMGLIKRGLFALSAFFLIIYGLTLVTTPLLAFCIPILCLTTFFDGFAIRRRINNGEAVKDDIGDILSFVDKNKAPLLLAVVIACVLTVLSSVTKFSYYHHATGIIVPLAIILGIYFLVKAVRDNRTNER